MPDDSPRASTRAVADPRKAIDVVERIAQAAAEIPACRIEPPSRCFCQTSSMKARARRYRGAQSL